MTTTWTVGTAITIACAVPVEGTKAYPEVDHLRRSPSWRVSVNGQEQFVYRATKDTHHGTHGIDAMSFVNFDLDGPAQVTVSPTPPGGTFAIRPYSTGLPANLQDDSIQFELSRPQQLVITRNNTYQDVLVLAANPPHSPPEPDAVQHYFGPGLHRWEGHLPLVSGDHVYVAAGAVVEGAFSLNQATNVTINGRGIIHGGNFPHQEAFRVFKGDHTAHVLIEGITVCNAPGWIVSFWGGNTDLTVRQVKMVGNFRYNTDGVQTGTVGLLVENSFLQCNDDNFSLNGVCQDVVIRNNVLWNLYNGGVFMLGWATGEHFDLRNIRFENINILRAWTVAGEIHGHSPENPVEAVTFKNIQLAGNPMNTPAQGGLNLIHTRNVQIERYPFEDKIVFTANLATPRAGLHRSP